MTKNIVISKLPIKSGAFFLALLLSAACINPFSTREPEPPEQNFSSFINPSIPELVFLNMELAFRERNVENYIRNFVDLPAAEQEFVFVPDQGVMATHPGTFSDWQLTDERLYLQQLFQATPTDSINSLTFFEESRNEGAENATFTHNYEIIARHARGGNFPEVVRGQSKFWLNKNDTGLWTIYRWEDFTNGTDPSWSELKAAFQ